MQQWITFSVFFITCPSDSVVSSLLAPFAHQATKGQRGHVTLRQDPFDHHSDPRYRGAIDLRILAENGGFPTADFGGFFTLSITVNKHQVCSGLS